VLILSPHLHLELPLVFLKTLIDTYMLHFLHLILILLVKTCSISTPAGISCSRIKSFSHFGSIYPHLDLTISGSFFGAPALFFILTPKFHLTFFYWLCVFPIHRACPVSAISINSSHQCWCLFIFQPMFIITNPATDWIFF